MIKVANAPVSFGVFELTAGRSSLPHRDDILSAVSSAGYDGIDLGPPGYLGLSDVGERLTAHGLALAGGWIAMRFSDPDGFEEDLAVLDQTLEVMDAVGRADREHPAKPTLADAGSRVRRDNPGRGADLPEIGLDATGWSLLADNVGRATAACRERGLEPTFHHHACTYVEAPHEIERVLEMTDVGLCLDSGHLLLGGGDPVDALTRWNDRINHVHVKDCRMDVLRAVLAHGEGMESVWRRGVFCELGAGDVDVDGFLDGLRGLGYAGWFVVEQDTISSPGTPFDDLAAAQARNREFLRARGI
ncbi:MAG: sugar phosphate isomerase/epimerase [Actinomycetota bacterium]|nr:sugar phosphate isomerase/epimerase [Actinomycetota bacterium]